MLSDKQMEKLKANWEKAESMECYAEVRLYHPFCRKLEAYIYALDPDSPDNRVLCIVRDFLGQITVRDTPLACLENIYLVQGEEMLVDTEYRPRIAKEIYKKLLGDYGNRD